MDPSIFKLLEEEEKLKWMHSEAEMDAFQADLNQYIEGFMTNPGNNHSPSQQFSAEKNGIGDADINLPTQHIFESTQMKEQQGSSLYNQHQNELNGANDSCVQQSRPQDLHQSGQLWENPAQVPQTSGMQISEKNPTGNEPERSNNQESESQYMKLQNMSSQQTRGVAQPVNPMNRNLKHVPFSALLPTLMALLDKDRALQLHTLYSRLRKNEISKKDFARDVNGIVSKQMLKLAASKLRQTNYNQGNIGIQPSSTVHRNQLLSPTSGSLFPLQGLTKHPQEQMQFPPSSSSMYTSLGSFHNPGANTNASGSTLVPHLHDSHMRHVEHNQAMVSTGLGEPPQPTKNMITVPKFERPTSVNDPNRVQGGAASHVKNSSLPVNSPSGQGSSASHLLQESVEQRPEHNNLEKKSSRMVLTTPSNMAHVSSVSPSMKTQLDSTTTMNPRDTSGTSHARTPPQKPSVGQKRPLEALGSSPQPASKKQIVAGNFMDQSIEQLNDVTAVSGVNLKEEEEQLFSGGKEDCRVSEASVRVVHKEEEKLILQKSPLQKKLAEIMAKVGLKSISSDFEQCLSLCVEERMRALLSHIIQLSKQRVDGEKSRHHTFITSDIQLQIIEMSQRVKEEWEKKQSEEGDGGVDSEKEKEGKRSKVVKVNKEEEDKMRTTAANVAARVAVGGDDAFLKWQLMAEARQKSNSGGRRNSKDKQDGTGRWFYETDGRRLGKKVVRSISIKDVISVLERDPQMSKSTLMYRLIQ